MQRKNVKNQRMHDTSTKNGYTIELSSKCIRFFIQRFSAVLAIQSVLFFY